MTQDISSSSLKMGRIICELERIYGISKGNNQHTNNVGFQKTQKDVADEMGIDNMESYRNYKKLTTLIPELQDMVDTGSLTTSVASRNPKGTNVRDLDNTSDITQEQIAQQYNISIDKYRNAEKLLNLIPELQDMVQENKVSTTVASRIIARLSPADQKQLILTYCKRRKCNLCDDVYEILLAEKKLIS